jgi:hypothetical protein
MYLYVITKGKRAVAKKLPEINPLLADSWPGGRRDLRHAFVVADQDSPVVLTRRLRADDPRARMAAME